MAELEEELTVFHDDGRKPIFEKFPTREAAVAEVARLMRETGRIAIILEDYDE